MESLDSAGRFSRWSLSSLLYYRIFYTFMMKLGDKDLDPSVDCHFVAMGNTDKEVAKKLLAHMKTAHPEKLEEMGLTDDEAMDMFEEKAHA